MSAGADARARLAAMLRPAGGGLYVVSTGRADQVALQRELYGADDDAAIAAAHQAMIDSVAEADVVMLGVPSDTGAGFRRGANLAPPAIRRALLAHDPDLRAWRRAHRVVDLGDLLVVPQLLHDEMLAPAQVRASRAAMYAGVAPALADTLPVSPLSMLAQALADVHALRPDAKLLVLGGDHSVAWPVAEALARQRTDRWAIVQPDAHTDLLPHRLGVRYCFATWSYHANELLGRDGRLVQVGVRASGRDQAHWEGTLGVRQFWAAQIARDPAAALEAVVAHLRAVGASSIYFSNDIDGTDAALAPATGTPEPGGLSAEWLLALIARLGREFGLCAADCVEVAPALGPTPEAGVATVALAARYVRACLDVMVGGVR